MSILVALLVFGTLAMAFAQARGRIASSMQSWLLESATELYSEAERANLNNDPVLVALHNQLVYSAALVPALAVGLVKLGPGELPKEERDALHEFLGRNRWVIEYAIVTPLAASVLQFHAEPWKIKRWGSALFAYLVFRFRGANISIRLTNEVAVEKIEDASRWDEGHHRRQGPFGHAHPA